MLSKTSEATDQIAKTEAQWARYRAAFEAGEITDQKLADDFEKSLNRFERELARSGIARDQLYDVLCLATGQSREIIASLFESYRTVPDKLRSNDIYLGSEHLTKGAIADSVHGLDIIAQQLFKDSATFGFPVYGDGILSAYEWDKNSCGAKAAFSLLTLHKEFAASADNLDVEDKLVKRLMAACDAGPLGTMPKNITQALESEVPKGFLVQHREFQNSAAAVEHIKQHLPALVKVGANITRQHYTTISEIKTIEGRDYALTSDNRIIPLEKLEKMLDVKPYANSVWTIERQENSIDNLSSMKMPTPAAR